VRVVGLVSAFREGRLTLGCIRSLAAVGLDDLLVSEGPAGELPEGIMEAPPSEYPEGLAVNHGRWRTDARKRDAMLKEAKRRHVLRGEEPLWGVWLDGDELLAHGEYLRDRLQAVLWDDEARGGPATLNLPLWTKEADGSLAVTGGRLIRLDLVASYEISVSVVRSVGGEEQGVGNVDANSAAWLELWLQAVDKGRMIAWPPGPLEPCIVHRSGLRHPARRGLRLHRQEADELRKAGKPTSRGPRLIGPS
jgi:hypothetical protein